MRWEAMTEMTEHFTTGRFVCHREFVDACLRADKRDHFSMAHERRVWNVSYIDGQKIHGRLPHDQARPATDDCV